MPVSGISLWVLLSPKDCRDILRGLARIQLEYCYTGGSVEWNTDLTQDSPVPSGTGLSCVMPAGLLLSGSEMCNCRSAGQVHSVASGTLGGVQGMIGFREQLLQRQGRRTSLHYAEAGCYINLA